MQYLSLLLSTIKLKSWFRVIPLFLSILFSFNAYAALTEIEAGPKLGSPLPKLAVLDQFSNKQKIENVSGSKGTVIVVFRSADWCPFCKRHLLELNPLADKFNSKGYGVTAISYDSPEILRAFAQENELNFRLLSDQNAKSFEALNVLNAKYPPSDKHYGIPYPGVIVVDNKGLVTHKYFYEGYKKRVKFEQLLRQLN
ncbi:MAG: peroxiredoxin family protein [Kangiellaceae bacterium]|nr:peroxiredoxin family protein [Kangiellaceae bacterium]